MTKYELTPMERELAELMVNVLLLEIEPDQIDPKAALFRDGLGLDSIDALELAIYLKKDYELLIKVEDEETRSIFASLSDLAAYVEENLQP